MTIKILTLFPEMIDAMKVSVIGRALKKNVIDIEAVNIRDYTADKHGKCDDTPFGGGAGMVMTPQPIYDAIQAADPNHEMIRIFTSPKGRVFNDKIAREFAADGRDVLILCGHYEGVDNRIIELCIDEEISIGDYVLTGGELAAMVISDAVVRFVSGVLGSEESSRDESFASGMLEYPQYTRPQTFMGLTVPEVLLSGNHAQIAEWRRTQAEQITALRRPDLLKK